MHMFYSSCTPPDKLRRQRRERRHKWLNWALTARCCWFSRSQTSWRTKRCVRYLMVFGVPGISTLGFSGKRFDVEQEGLQYPFSEELKTWNVTWSSLACSIDLIREKTCLIPCQAYLPRLLIPMVLLRCPHKMPDSSDTQICWEEIKQLVAELSTSWWF